MQQLIGIEMVPSSQLASFAIKAPEALHPAHTYTSLFSVNFPVLNIVARKKIGHHQRLQ
jgi:hypothetical protein